MKQKTLEWAGPYGARCSVCSPETEETHTNLPFGLVTLPSEPAMNAAGRTSDHPFKDLRSARRTYQRSKRYPERIYSGNKRRRSDKSPPKRLKPPSPRSPPSNHGVQPRTPPDAPFSNVSQRTIALTPTLSSPRKSQKHPAQKSGRVKMSAYQSHTLTKSLRK